MWMYLLTAFGLTPVGGSTVHIYTQTVHRTTQLTTNLMDLPHIIRHFPYNVIFLLHFILFIAELHMLPHLPRFYHNDTLRYSILSF